jgi:hypothetical protein
MQAAKPVEANASLRLVSFGHTGAAHILPVTFEHANGIDQFRNRWCKLTVEFCDCWKAKVSAGIVAMRKLNLMLPAAVAGCSLANFIGDRRGNIWIVWQAEFVHKRVASNRAAADPSATHHGQPLASSVSRA